MQGFKEHGGVKGYFHTFLILALNSVFIKSSLLYTTYIMIVQKAKKTTCFDCKQSSSGLIQYFHKLQC
jgi:hypothetical protein